MKIILIESVPISKRMAIRFLWGSVEPFVLSLSIANGLLRGRSNSRLVFKVRGLSLSASLSLIVLNRTLLNILANKT